MSDITREKAVELLGRSIEESRIGPEKDAVVAFANAVRADFARELLGMDVKPVAHGELHPKSAQETARQMLRYTESFNGQRWGGIDETVDRRNLAVALDNLEETAAMLLNISDRVDKATTQAAAMRLLEREACAKTFEALHPDEWGFAGAAIRNRKD